MRPTFHSAIHPLYVLQPYGVVAIVEGDAANVNRVMTVCGKECSGQANENRATLDLDGIGHKVLAGGTTQDLTSWDIEARPMPRAGDHHALKLAFVQRADNVGAIIVESIDGALEPGEADRLAIYLDGIEIALLQIIQLRYFKKSGH